MKDTASGITDVERALHVPKRRQGDQPGPGCARGRAGVGMTEFSAVPAYNPVLGREGIERQVCSVVDDVIERHQAHGVELPQQVEKLEQRLRRAVKVG
jgi:hypothetical protein